MQALLKLYKDKNASLPGVANRSLFYNTFISQFVAFSDTLKGNKLVVQKHSAFIKVVADTMARRIRQSFYTGYPYQALEAFQLYATLSYAKGLKQFDKTFHQIVAVDQALQQKVDSYNYLRKYTDAPYLSSLEKDVLFYLNLARVAPKLYCDFYIMSEIEYVYSGSIEYVSFDYKYFWSLVREMNTRQPISYLKTADFLCKTTKYHANDIVVNMGGKTNHYSSNGNSCHNRIKSFTKSYIATAETIASGMINSGYQPINLLLIDKYVPSLGHRDIILDGDYEFVGVALKLEPKTEYFVTVIDYCY